MVGYKQLKNYFIEGFAALNLVGILNGTPAIADDKGQVKSEISELINKQFGLKDPFERHPYSPLMNYSARTEIDAATGDRYTTLEKYSTLRMNELSCFWNIADIDINAAYLDVANHPKMSEGSPNREKMVMALATAYAKMNGCYDSKNNIIDENKARSLKINQKVATQYCDVKKYKEKGLTDEETNIVEYVHNANLILDFAQYFWKQYPQLRQDIMQYFNDIDSIKKEGKEIDKSKISEIEKKLLEAKVGMNELNNQLSDLTKKYNDALKKLNAYETKINELNGNHKLELDKQKSEYDKKISVQKEGYEKELNEKRQDYEKGLKKYNENIDTLEEKLNSLNEILKNAFYALRESDTIIDDLGRDVKNLESKLKYSKEKGKIELNAGVIYDQRNGKVIGAVAGFRKPLVLHKNPDGSYEIKSAIGFDAGGTYKEDNEIIVPHNKLDLGDGFTAEVSAARHKKNGHVNLTIVDEFYLRDWLGISLGAGVYIGLESSADKGIERLILNGNPIGETGIDERNASSTKTVKPYGHIGATLKPSENTAFTVDFDSQKNIRIRGGIRF